MQSDEPGVTGQTLLDAQFDRRATAYWRVLVSLFMAITIVGIPFIPIWLIYSLWFAPKYFDSLSARLTTQALELRKGVFTRSESTVPLNRITDLRLYQGPLMRRFGLHGLKVETAGQSGQNASSEGNLLGVVDAAAASATPSSASARSSLAPNHPRTLPVPTPSDTTKLLTEIRDILARMEARQ